MIVNGREVFTNDSITYLFMWGEVPMSNVLERKGTNIG